MNKDGVFWISLWTVIVTGLVIIFVGMMKYEYNIKKVFVENGYEMVSLPGQATSKWQKVDCQDKE